MYLKLQKKRLQEQDQIDMGQHGMRFKNKKIIFQICSPVERSEVAN